MTQIPNIQKPVDYTNYKLYYKNNINSKYQNRLHDSDNIFLSESLNNLLKKHRQINLQRLQKVGIWTVGSLLHQIISL